MSQHEPKRVGVRALRVVRSGVCIAALSYVGCCLYACFAADGVIFQPQPSSYADGPGILKIRTADGGTISAVRLESADAELTILYSHGNAEDLGDVRPFLEALQANGFDVLAYDYRGYGTSHGRPSERNAYRDAEAAYRYLVTDLGLPPERIIAYGRSLGGALGCHLAAQSPLGGLVLDSSFVTAFRVVTRVPLLPFDKFSNIRKIRKVGCPVLIIHGTDDRVVPPWHGRKLFERAHEPKLSLWLEGAGHNDPFWATRPEYWSTLAHLAALVRQAQHTPAP